MLKPPMPGMTDTLEFVKNLWGGMQIPGAVPGLPALPGAALSVEELDKKIADLKAVEAWLNLNVGMLHGSIQALEIQRGTLVTLKAMGDSMAQAMSQTGTAGESAMAPFAHFFTQAATPAATAATAPPPPQPAPDTTQADATAAAMPAAVAWWNMLQDQFRQAVVNAMPADGGATPETAAEPPADAPAPGRRTRGKTDKA